MTIGWRLRGRKRIGRRSRSRRKLPLLADTFGGGYLPDCRISLAELKGIYLLVWCSSSNHPGNRFLVVRILL